VANLIMAATDPPMASSAAFRFDNSFARELEGCYVAWRPAAVPAPRLMFLNHALAEELGLDVAAFDGPAGAATFAGNTLPDGAEPLAQAIGAAREAQRQAGVEAPTVIHLSPSGVPLLHRHVLALASKEKAGYVLLAGRYEGIDERLLAREADMEISIGDFVVSGGELPALLLIDAVVRQLPGALNDEQSAQQDSFAEGLLDCPHYTRPETQYGMAVPDVLLSGHHAQIRRWRLMQSLGRTWERRPDLLADRRLTDEEAALLALYRRECGNTEVE